MSNQQERNDWIDVNDFLPPCVKVVVALDSSGCVDDAIYKGNGEFALLGRAATITHWMPRRKLNVDENIEEQDGEPYEPTLEDIIEETIDMINELPCNTSVKIALFKQIAIAKSSYCMSNNLGGEHSNYRFNRAKHISMTINSICHTIVAHK